MKNLKKGSKMKKLLFAITFALSSSGYAGNSDIGSSGISTKGSSPRAVSDVVVEAPSEASVGRLLVRGSAGGEQSDIFTVCRYKLGRNSVPLIASLAQNTSCSDGALNESLELQSGSYLLIYHNTSKFISILSNRTTRVDLLKIKFPINTNISGVSVHVDYTNRSMQNQYMKILRIQALNEDFIKQAQLSNWGKLNLEKFIRTGDPSDLSDEVREIAFTEKGATCSFTTNGTVSNDDCERTDVGVWYPRKTELIPGKSLMMGLVILKKSEYVTVNKDPSLAFVSVLPGVYLLEWMYTGNRANFIQTGVKAN